MTVISSPLYRWRVGEVEITRVLEFEAALFEPAVLYPEVSREVVRRHRGWLEPTLMDPVSGLLVFAFHSTVIRTPRATILVDTCSGNDKERPHKRHLSGQQASRPFRKHLVVLLQVASGSAAVPATAHRRFHVEKKQRRGLSVTLPEHLVGERAERDVSVPRAGDDRQQMRKRSAETIEFPDHQAVALGA
jgi:hypothetical protein